MSADLKEDILKACRDAEPSMESQLWAQLRAAQEENERLKAENAELREKCMTNMERIQTADKYELATMILAIHAWGYTDAYEQYSGSPLFCAEIPEDVEDWLDKLEWD